MAESLSFQSSDDLIEVDVNRFLLSSKRLANENVALASQLSFLCHAPHYVKEIKLPVSFDRSCCRFWHLAAHLNGCTSLKSSFKSGRHAFEITFKVIQSHLKAFKSLNPLKKPVGTRWRPPVSRAS